VPPGRAQNAPPTVAPAFQRAPTVTAPLPAVPPPAAALTPIARGAAAQGPRRLDDFRGQRREVQEGGRTVITEPGRIIIRDPGGQQYVRHSEVDRFRYGARDIQTQTVGGETRTVVIRPDGTQVITVVGRDGQLLRRIRRDERGREIIIIDNSYRDPRAGAGFFVALAPPMIRMPYNRYIVDADEASPELLYETMMAPPVERIDRRYSLDEIRYSPSVRQRMPSIDVNTINFETGSWEIPPDQAAKLQAIADGLNRAIQENPRVVFLIEGHTDAVGNDVDNLSLSDRRAEAAATLLTQQFNVPEENLTSQGYGEQYLKEQTDGPSAINRRVTIRNITPLLNGGQAALPPPPPGTAPPR
jgi:outer membrane protein OmpA-like peptidoglycan-associated protein